MVCVGLFQEDFVSSYIFMYLLTPVMNAYIKTATGKQMKTILIVFYCVIFTSGLLFWNPSLQGKSILPFCALYMLGRYVRLHSSLPGWSAKKDISIWMVIVLSMTVAVWICAFNGYTDHLGNIALNMSTSYLNPAVIAMSLFMLLFFSRFHFHNRFINWCGISSFAAVLLHCWMFAPGEYVRGYASFLRLVYGSMHPIVFVAILPIIFLSIFLLSVLIDKVRIYLWERIYNKLFTKRISNI